MAPNRRLKQARELRGWSQAKVAELIGTDATTVSRWERGIFSPTPYFRERLCNLFGKNAAELGLLETAEQSLKHDQNGFSLHPPFSMPSLQANEEQQREALYEGNVDPPSWPKRTDTLLYILHSAAHDQQAHMLWGDAYVQELHGRHAEAQQLGEASLSAFERVGHLNATVIREWLNQSEATSSSPSTSNVSPASLPLLPEQHKRSTRKRVLRRGTGIALVLMVVVTFILASYYSLSQLGSPAMASSSTNHPAFIEQMPTQDTSPSKVVGNLTPTLVPSPTPAPASSSPTPSPTPAPASSPAPSAAFLASVIPANLTSQNCFLESLGYRCDLKLELFTNGSQGTFSWQIGGTVMLANSPLQGNGTTGKTKQITVYIPQGQKGQIIVTFIFASHTYPVSVNWRE